jgi:hypothetical protein
VQEQGVVEGDVVTAWRFGQTSKEKSWEEVRCAENGKKMKSKLGRGWDKKEEVRNEICCPCAGVPLS